MENFSLQKFDPSKSLFIEASAGTGKTYTIQLMVAKLISLGTPLKKILIVTYTEKAAGELKDRIRKKIDEVLVSRKLDKTNEAEKELDDATLALFSKAYQDVDNAAIFTIHSFCQKALKEYAYDAGRPFDMSMIDDSEVHDLVEQFIRDKWSDNSNFQFLLKTDSAQSIANKVATGLENIVNVYRGSEGDREIIPLDKPEQITFGDTALSDDDIRTIAIAKTFDDILGIPVFGDAFSTLEKHPAEKFGKTSKNCISDFLSALKLWEKDKTLFSGVSFKDSDFVRTTWPTDAYEAFLSFKALKELLPSINNVLLNNFLISQAASVFDEWQKYKTEKKCQSFNDMILSVHRAALDTSKGDSLLKSRLRAQYTYAIIDEFQDTNQLQWDIFSAIFDKIFVVGDPKQSIYSFQSADVNVYQKAIHEIKNGMSLQTNFRSTTGIINGCNELFKGDFFTPNEGATKLVDFEPSLPPQNEKQVKAPPKINDNEVAPIWISEQDINEVDFARAAVQKIIDWCTFVDGKTVLQVFKKEDCTQYRNVTFKDFAVLARSRSEMDAIEDAMRSAGVPFSRYKDSNLFSCRECAEWIAIFKAINAPDFSAWNRRLLSEALITDFFRIARQDIHYAESKAFDDPNNPVRQKLNTWTELAQKRRYAEMLERIYSDTQVEERLTEISRLQNLARLRQIGNYAIEYLYNHNCSIEDLVRHLEALASYSENADDEDGNLVEKSSDYDAVQVMTIHASKGLEFPVVISVAGFKGKRPATVPFLYHDNDEIRLGFSEHAKTTREREELEEWKRLFYVDFTRASSILMLPRYEKWKNTKGVKPEYVFLESSINRLIEKASELTAILPKAENRNPQQLSETVKERILKPLNENSEIGKALSTDEIRDNIIQQKCAMASLQGKLADASIMQYSYSSLSGKADTLVDADDGNRTNREGEEIATSRTSTVQIRDIDTAAVNCTIAADASLDYQTHLNESAHKFPRGSHAGNALHRIFECTQFQKFGLENKTLEDALANPQTRNIIEEEFKRESLPIWNHRDAWIDIATRYTWNTLNARLPEIAGNSVQYTEQDSAGNAKQDAPQTFALIDIPLSDHKPEVQFNQNATDENDEKCTSDEKRAESDILKRFCKGFIDLLFVRTINSQKYYSILDWKSDMLENNNYTPEALKEKVDNDYSIQRVLYSYCLIQWLKQFYGEGTAENLSEDDIFKKHFGGIYYAFIRGTEGGTPKGIYAQTWNSYTELANAYQKVKDLMSKPSIVKEEN
ncbi:exodeoxyribonuclease V [Fibrobacter sp. UWB2]|uniref:UvrD-helicase domain-containing protein n=1 Tax=Fibrobacter sp. UWB2 TaxID=1964358 RepID=UPI000B51EF82|nr:UvrD-helicase domain-containing protein [Fibrobacter sp. UWB2]OWV23202.1 exodeoxyribonuclease V [Fibrobacter sp. UWB2]